MKRILFLLITIIPLMYGCSNYGEIEGRVLDKLSGKSIKGVSITVKGTSLQANTESDGTYKIAEVIPGVQKLVVTKDSYIALSETELTIAKGTTSKCADIFLIQKPSTVGLFVVGNSLNAIPKIRERNVSPSMNETNYIINTSSIPKSETVSTTMQLLLYEGESTQKSSEVHIFQMKFFPMKSMGFFGNVPERWVTQDEIHSLKVESLTPALAQISGTLSQGRYCVQVKHSLGVEDWYFVLDVK